MPWELPPRLDGAAQAANFLPASPLRCPLPWVSLQTLWPWVGTGSSSVVTKTEAHREKTSRQGSGSQSPAPPGEKAREVSPWNDFY